MSQSFFYHNKSLIRTSNLQVPTVENVDGKLSVKFSTKTYPEFLKDNTQTNLRSVDLGNGNYSYTVQRNIVFATPKVEKIEQPKVEKPIVESKPTINIKSAELTGQGKSIEIEIIGDSGKEFLLIIDRNGRIDLFSEKQKEGDYHQGQPAPKADIEKLYNKYVSKDIRDLILNWQNSFTGSWAAEETDDGIRYDIAEKELVSKLNLAKQKPEVREKDISLGVAKVGQIVYDKNGLEYTVDSVDKNGRATKISDVLFGGILNADNAFIESPVKQKESEVREKPKLQQRRGNGKSIERKKPLSDEDLMPNFNEVAEESTEFKTKPKANTLQMDFITFAKMQEPEIKRSLIAMNRNKEIEVKCK